jgi:hypothetical protein
MRSPSAVTSRDRGLAAGREHPDPVARPDGAADGLAAEPPEVVVGPVDPLDRQPERSVLDVVVDLDNLQVVDEWPRRTRGCWDWTR